MKNIKLFFLISLSFLIYSCDDENDCNKYYYLETQCADPWGFVVGASESVVVDSVQNYLTTLDISVKNISVENNDFGEACLACTCLSGRSIILEASDDQETSLLDLNFVKE